MFALFAFISPFKEPFFIVSGENQSIILIIWVLVGFDLNICHHHIIIFILEC